MPPMNDQRSAYDQLRDLIQLANANGLYDAADVVQQLVDRWDAACTATQPMTPQEQLVYAAAYAKVYTDTYPGYEHCVAAARAVKAAQNAAESLRVMPALLAMNQTGFEREVKQIEQEFEQHGRRKTSGEYVAVSDNAKAAFNRFLK